VACTTCKQVVLIKSVGFGLHRRKVLLTFFIRKTGVGINAKGLSAHVFEEEVLLVITSVRGKRMSL
jgi:hypothetical protein